jgi:molybdate transport system substrate-binding protein
MMIADDGGRRRFLSRFLMGMVLLGVFHLYPNQSLNRVSAPTLSTAQAEDQLRVTGELTVFAAASLTEPFTEIGKRLELSHPGLKVVYNFGGSPTLRTQLEQGAHADVFASADAVQMEQAKKSNVVQGESPVFVKNRLVAIVPKENKAKATTFCDLGKPGLKLDLANAKVPVGHYSRQAIAKASTECGADFEQRTLKNLVSEEENVKQVVTKIQLGEADAGIVYVSDVTPKVSKDVQTIAIAGAYNQLATYPIALTADVKNRPGAEAFLTFVLSAEGQAVLKAHNFIPLKE